jgi:PAS domain S-box-containing protein
MIDRSTHPLRIRATGVAALGCLFWLATPTPGLGQPASAPDSAYSIAVAVRDADGDGRPERLHQPVEVEGTITLPPVPLGDLGSFALLQGDAAVVLYSLDSSALEGLERGQRVRVSGLVRQYQDQEQVYVKDFDILGTGKVPEHAVLHAADLGDRWSGQLVRIEGTLRVEKGGSAFAFRVEDETGSVPIYVSGQLMTDVDRLNRLLRSQGRRIQVQGALMQGRVDGLDTREHYILPLSSEDMVLPVILPLREIFAGALLVLLVSTIAYMARKRQAAQLEAEAQQALANRLRLSESALRETEQRLRHMLETSTSILYRTVYEDGVTRTVWMSENVTWLLGYTTEEAMPINWFRDCLHPDDREGVLGSFLQLIRSGKVGEHASQEYRFKHRDGTYSWFRNDLRVAVREGDRVELVGASFDITEEKEAALGLIAAEAHYRRLVETSPYGIFALDGEARFTEVNPVVAEVFGKNISELLGASAFESLPPECIPIIEGEYERQRVDASYRSDFEMRMRRVDGDERILHIRSAPVLEGDRVVGAHGVLRDITEERARESRVHLLGAALENLNHGVAITDSGQNTVFANREFRCLMGAEAEDELPRLDSRLPDDAARHQLTEISQALETSGRWSGRFWRRRTDNGRVFPLDAVVGLVPATDGGEPLYLTICSDASEAIQQEQQFRRAERLASLGTLVGGVAHELNNPLNVIINFAALLEGQAQNPEDREDLATIVTEGQRAARIVAGMQAVARQADLPEIVADSVDVNQILENVLQACSRALADAGIRVSLDVHPDLPRVPGDRMRIEQALTNIVANAEQAIAETGSGGILKVASALSPRGVEVIVEDDGPGIPAAHLDRIFDPFWTTKDPGKGTGLGLSLAHSVINDHHGRISVRSDEGAGTKFRIELPLAAESWAAPAAPAAGAEEAYLVDEPDLPELSEEVRRVLIIDDEPAVRSLLVRYLERVGYLADQAPEGAEALRMLASTPYDVILSDLRMPGIGGEELLERLRADGRGLERRVVLMSGDTSEADNSARLRDVPILAKPVALADVSQAIERCLAAA